MFVGNIWSFVISKTGSRKELCRRRRRGRAPERSLARQCRPATRRATQTPAYGLGGRRCGPRVRRGPSASSLGRAPCLCTGPRCPGPRARVRECQAAACMRSASWPRCAVRSWVPSPRPRRMVITRASQNQPERHPLLCLPAPERRRRSRASLGVDSVRRRLSILAELAASPSFPPPLLHHCDIPCSGLVQPARYAAGIEPHQGRRPPLPSPAILRTISTPPEPKNRTLGEPLSIPTTSPVHPGDELAGFWISPSLAAARDYIARSEVFLGAGTQNPGTCS
jgi:hypothetical protein